MTAEEFVRQLNGENQRRLSRLAPDDTLKPEVEGDLNVLKLLKVALKNEIEATEIAASLRHDPRLVLLDLTAGYDYDRVFAALEGARPAVLGFTTHALARQTQPWHPRCARVVTKETLTQELPRLLKKGVTA